MTICSSGCEKYEHGKACCRWDGIPWPEPREIIITDPKTLAKLATVFGDPA